MIPDAPQRIGRYHVVGEIKSGGMGTVYLARDPRIGQYMGGRFVAIKVLHEFNDQLLRARFEREADIAGTLDHRNIVQIYDRDEHEGRPFIVMEYVDGETLGEVIKTGSVPLVRRVQLMEELCDGLACAHRSNVVHRDIKPANLMVRSQDGVLKILDFGIARATVMQANLTRGILGTMNYMAPEQWEPHGTVDGRTDMFAAGAVFYELLCGAKAFPGVDIPTIYRQIATLPAQPLESRHASLDPDLVTVVNRCLEKRPFDRYPDMDSVRAELSIVRQRLVARAEAVTFVHPALPLVTKAQRALEEGKPARALESCEEALKLEPGNSIALDLRSRILSVIEIERWLRDARKEYEQGALTAAALLIDQVLERDRANPDALGLTAAIAAERQRLEQARRVDAALSKARDNIRAVDTQQAQDWDTEMTMLAEAVASASAVLHLDPNNAEAIAVRDLALSMRQQRIDWVTAVIDQARNLFEAGQHVGAIEALSEHRRIPKVAEALRELQGKYAKRRAEERERQRQEQDKELKRAEEHRAKISRRVQELLAGVREALKSGQLRADGSLPAGLAEAIQLDPSDPEVIRVTSDVEAAIAALRSRAEEEAQRAAAQRQIAAANAGARQVIAEAQQQSAGDLAGAIARLAAHQPVHADVTAALVAMRAEYQRQQNADQLRRETEERARVDAVRQERARQKRLRQVEAQQQQRAPAITPADLQQTVVNPLPTDKPLPSRPRVPAWLHNRGVQIAVALLIVSMAVVLGRRADQQPEQATPAANGTAVVNVTPWANLSITRRSDGRPVGDSELVTPTVISLPAGEYRVRASNPNFPAPLEFDLSLSEGQVQEVHYAMPQFEPEKEIRQILDK